ncbi:MAG: hypothetical protein ACK50U_02725 [Acidobacteriota bacterium]|jgi:hypothetical protein
MKTILLSIMIAATAITAFAAERQLRFSTSKPIIVGKKTLPAGSYTVERGGVSRRAIYIESKLSREGAFLSLPILVDTASSPSSPAIKLACDSASCQVVQVSGLTEGNTYRSVSAPNGEMVVISMRSPNAE